MVYVFSNSDCHLVYVYPGAADFLPELICSSPEKTTRTKYADFSSAITKVNEWLPRVKVSILCKSIFFHLNYIIFHLNYITISFFYFMSMTKLFHITEWLEKNVRSDLR